MSSVNYIDIAIIVLVLLFMIVGIFKGFLRPLITLVGLGGAAALIYFYAVPFGGVIGGWGLTEALVGNEGFAGFAANINFFGTSVESAASIVCSLIAGAIILIGMIILTIIVKSIVKRIAAVGPIKAVDRVFGAVFYIAIGALVAFVLLMILDLICDAIIPILDPSGSGYKVMFDIQKMMIPDPKANPSLTAYMMQGIEKIFELFSGGIAS